MKKLLALILVIAISAATALAVSGRTTTTDKADSLATVLANKTLRCGFVDYEPANFRDAKTGELKGILVETAEAIGKKLDLKIEWVQAGGWATFITDLETGKYDAFCGAAWAIQPREMTALEATVPIYFSAISAWVRESDNRFTSALDNINDPSVTIAATDGSLPSIIAQQRYPNAKVFSLPETASYSMNLLNVANNKADIGFLEQYIGYQYAATNPGTVKNITPNDPIHISPNLFEVRKGDTGLLSMLNMTLNVLHDNGEIDAIISKYEPVPGTFLRRTPAYTRTNPSK